MVVTGKAIRHKRMAEGLTQLDLVNLLRLSGTAVVSRWERGHRAPSPRYKHYDRLMSWLNDGGEHVRKHDRGTGAGGKG